MKTNLKDFFLKVDKDIFIISLITFVVYFFFDYFDPGFVSNYFNLGYLLIVCLVSGMLFVIMDKEKIKSEPKKWSLGNYSLVLGISFLGGLLVFEETRELGWLSYFLGFISLVLIFLLIISMEEAD